MPGRYGAVPTFIAGNDYVKIFGERYRVRCKVRSMSGLSAHADYGELLRALTPLAES